MPGERWQRLNEFGDYCLLRNKQRVRQKVEDVKGKVLGIQGRAQR